MSLPDAPDKMNIDSDIWHPDHSDLQSSGVVQLMAAFGVTRYEDMLTLSLREPARYWDVVMKYCRIVWDSPPHEYLDESSGPEFPQCFPGGRLNWVNTVLAWG